MDVVALYALLVGGSIVALCVFMALPVEPFAYYKDLGFDHEVTDWAVHTVRSPQDFIDALGWAPWNGAPLFFLNSYAGLLISAPLALIVKDSWFAIKIVQVLELFVAAAGAYVFYATRSASRLWGIAFAVLFATLPTTVLAIRGNTDMGWIAALAPAVLATGRLSLRRYGARSLPFLGFICGVAGYVIGLEFLVFVSLPLYALLICDGWRKRSRVSMASFAPLGVATCLLSGAFFVIPTFVHPLFSDAAARTQTLVTGAFLGNFSETWKGLLTLVPRESFASPMPQFNAVDALWILYGPGALLWIGALGLCALSPRRGADLCGLASIFVVAVCIVLALGTAVPFGNALWASLFLLPHLNAIRTTDRFLEIPALIVAFWFVCGAQTAEARLAGPLRRVPHYLVFATTLAFVGFAASQHCFTVDYSSGIRQPEIDAVRTVVEHIGGRTAPFAGVNGGSFDDASEYGIPQPISAAYWDLGGRFMLDGRGAAGALGRMGVRSVITAPNWTYDTPDYPDSSLVYRRVNVARPMFVSPEDVGVWQIPARPAVSSTHIVCVWGGPGMFDSLDTAAPIRGYAFAAPGAACHGSAFADFDPRDRWRSLGPLDAWSGADLAPTAKRLRDVDYPFQPNRVLLNVPWYRNSIDGERPVFDPAGAVLVNLPTRLELWPHSSWPKGSVLMVRLDAHRSGTLDLSGNGITLGHADVAAQLGFHWYPFRLRNTTPATTPIDLALSPASGNVTNDAVNGYALDGIALVSAYIDRELTPRRSAFVAASLSKLLRPATAPIKEPSFAPGGTQEPTNLVGMRIENVESRPTFLVEGSLADAYYRWAGPSGAYIIEAKANLSTLGATVGLSTAKATCCSSTVSFDPSIPSQLFAARLHTVLAKGETIHVRMTQPRFDPSAKTRLVGLRVKRMEDAQIVSTSPELPAGASIDFAKPLDALALLRFARGITIGAGGAQGSSNAELAARVSIPGTAHSVSVFVSRSGDGRAALNLRCNGRSTRALVDNSASIAITGSSFSSCSVKVRWLSGSFALHGLTITAGGQRAPAASGQLWVPRGTFRLSLRQDDGVSVAVPSVHIAGCSGRPPVCRFYRSAFHHVSVAARAPIEDLLVLSGETPPPNVPLSVVQAAALRWSVHLRSAASDIVLTQLFDGNWVLANDHHAFFGERCDITDTCFAHVPPGDYTISHRWPQGLVLGFIATLFTLVASLTLMLFALPLPRAAARSK